LGESPSVVVAVPTVGQAMAPVDSSILDTLGVEVMTALESAYDESPEAFNKQRLREVYHTVTGRRLNTEKEKKVYEAFTAYMGT
jgi:hypothetical protein